MIRFGSNVKTLYLIGSPTGYRCVSAMFCIGSKDSARTRRSDPATAPIRPEHHDAVSITTTRITITRALARKLPRSMQRRRAVSMFARRPVIGSDGTSVRPATSEAWHVAWQTSADSWVRTLVWRRLPQ
jgi:hypothetical protein